MVNRKKSQKPPIKIIFEKVHPMIIKALVGVYSIIYIVMDNLLIEFEFFCLLISETWLFFS